MSQNKKLALGEIFNIARGGSPRPIQNFITNEKDGIPWIMIGDASEGSKYISDTKKRIIKEGVKSSRTVNPGDFLLTNSMSFGHPYIMKISGCIHDGWLVLSPKRNDIDQDYFYYLLGSNTVYEEFSRRASGTTVKNLNIDLVSGVTVSFPPLEEQRRIAAILDKADEVRRKRQQAIALTEELLKSLFLDMFGDPVINPKGWEFQTLGELLSEPLQNGAYYKKDLYLKDGTGVEMVHMSDAFYGIVERGDIKRVKATKADIEKYGLNSNDVIVARRSLNYEGAAKPCLIPNAQEPLIFESSLIRVRVNQKILDPIFFFSYMLLPEARKTFVFPHVTKSTISGINQAGLSRVQILLPPISMQTHYRKLYEKIKFLLVLKHEKYLNESNNLFNSLLQKAFRGEL